MTKCLICIDDTDDLESIGTGELADEMACTIQKNNWGETTRITRHQLYIHEDIPYTSHNSSMCFEAEIREEYLGIVTDFLMNYLEEHHAPGSDPGLCIVDLTQLSAAEKLIQFGKKAKKQILTKQEAYEFAEKSHIHLTEHGGTGLGVIGALAGCGLRLSGNDGKFRGKKSFPKDIMSVEELCLDSYIDEVQSIEGEVLHPDQMVDIGGNVKTVFLNYKSVLVVNKMEVSSEAQWKSIQKEQLKNY